MLVKWSYIFRSAGLCQPSGVDELNQRHLSETVTSRGAWFSLANSGALSLHVEEGLETSQSSPSWYRRQTFTATSVHLVELGSFGEAQKGIFGAQLPPCLPLSRAGQGSLLSPGRHCLPEPNPCRQGHQPLAFCAFVISCKWLVEGKGVIFQSIQLGGEAEGGPWEWHSMGVISSQPHQLSTKECLPLFPSWKVDDGCYLPNHD